MAKLLIVDDSPAVITLDDYKSFFKDYEVHHILYMGTQPKYLIYTAEKMDPKRFLENKRISSSQKFEHQELVDYLKNHKDEFEKIVLDGLEGHCIHLINDVPLDLTKTTVFTGKPSVYNHCEANNIPCIRKRF